MNYRVTPMMLGGLMMACLPAMSQKNDSAEHYFQKGIEEKTARRWLVASKHFDKAISFNAAYKEAYLENAYVHIEMRKVDQAKAFFAKVYELDPTNTTAAKELMELYYNHRQFAKARELAAKCSSCQNAEKITAMSAYQQEDYGVAVKGLLNYLAKNPTDAEATYTLARSYLDMEEYKNAVPYYTKAVALAPDKS
jgi:tetratricopeptide (TPR) repeat protein